MGEFEYDGLRKRYAMERPHYKKLAVLVAREIEDAAGASGLPCTISYRTKTIQSFLRKALRESKRYGDPHNEISDRAGVRVIAHYPWVLASLENLVKSLFTVLHCEDKRSITPPDKFVYRATHIQVAAPNSGPGSPEGLQCEVQLLTRAEALWADAEHDLSYKSPVPVPDAVKRRFYRLVSLVELFDLEIWRANEEMSTLERSPDERLLDILLPHYRRLTNEEYDRELSRLVLRLFVERVLPGAVEDVEQGMERFMSERSQKLADLLNRYKDDASVNPLLRQPELLVILFQLEIDPFILEEYWEDVLPAALLRSLADDWGVPVYASM